MTRRLFDIAPLEEYELGSVPRLYTVGPFAVDGIATDPDTLELTVTRPGANPYTRTFTYPVDPELVRVAAGDYYLVFVPHLTGIWHYTYRGTGAAQATATWRFRVWSPSATVLAV